MVYVDKINGIDDLKWLRKHLLKSEMTKKQKHRYTYK